MSVFSKSGLTAPYDEWKRHARGIIEFGDPELIAWLGSWDSWDLACSPMDDRERGLIRYGHYLGWFERGQGD